MMIWRQAVVPTLIGQTLAAELHLHQVDPLLLEATLCKSTYRKGSKEFQTCQSLTFLLFLRNWITSSDVAEDERLRLEASKLN